MADYAVKFNGSNQYIRYHDLCKWAPTVFTLSVWVWVDSTGSGDRYICGRATGASGSGIKVYIKSTGKLEVAVVQNSGVYCIRRCTVNFPTDQWVHIFVVWNGAASLQVWQDGVIPAYTTINSGAPTSQLSGVWCIGAVATGTATQTGYFKGYIADLQIYAKAIGYADVTKTVPTRKVNLTEIDNNELLFYAKLDEGSGTQALDLVDVFGYRNYQDLENFSGDQWVTGPGLLEALDDNKTDQDSAVLFNGANGFAYVESLGSPISEFAVEAWVFIPSTVDTTNISVFGYISTTGSTTVALALNSAGYMLIGVATGSSVYRVATANADKVPRDRWVHLAAEWKVSSFNLFMNGTKITHSVSSNGSMTGANFGNRMGVGGRGIFNRSDLAYPWVGAIRNVNLWFAWQWNGVDFTPNDGYNSGTETNLAFSVALDEAAGSTSLELVSAVTGNFWNYVDDTIWDMYFDFSGSPGWSDPSEVTPLSLPSPLPNLLMYNWEGGAELETRYQVDVVVSRTLDEDRRLLAGRPNRSVLLRHLPISTGELWQMFANLLRHGISRVPVPIYCDHSRVTGAASGVNIPCDTRYRRFFTGQRVLIHDWTMLDGGSRPGSYEFGEIESFTDSAITLKSSLSGSYAEGDRVLPCMDGEVELESAMELLSDSKGRISLVLDEVFGASALLPTATGTPDGYDEYNGYPILARRPSWSNIRPSLRREGTEFGLGRGRFVETVGSRPRFLMDIGYGELSRADIWPLIQLFDSRRGRKNAFFFVQPTAMFNPDAIAAGYVDIDPYGNFEDLEDFLSYIGFVERDGTVQVKEVDFLTDNTTTWRVTFTEDLDSTPNLADLRRVTPAHLVRFDTDMMRETWRTDEACSTSFRMLELVNEQTVEIA